MWIKNKNLGYNWEHIIKWETGVMEREREKPWI